MRRPLIQLAVLFLFVSCASAQDLTLEETLQRFIDSSPLVSAQRERLDAAQGRLRQSQAWSNPVLNYSQEGYPLGAESPSFDTQEFLIWATQEFELGGKRARRHTALELAAFAERARFDDFLREQRREIAELFVTAYHASSRRDVLQRVFDSYADIRSKHSKRYELGEVSGLAQLKIEAEELWYIVEISRSERSFNRAWSQLAASIGWGEPRPPQLVLPSPSSADLPSLEDMVALALERRPDLRRAQLDAQSAEAFVAVEKANKVPNVNLGGGYKRDFGQNSFFVGVQLPLPLWDRREGAIAERLADSRRLTTMTEWRRTSIRHEVERSYNLLQRLREAASRIDTSFVRDLDRMLGITQLSYEAGEASILEYLDAVRTQRSVLLERSRLEEELQQAENDLAAAVGVPRNQILP